MTSNNLLLNISEIQGNYQLAITGLLNVSSNLGQSNVVFDNLNINNSAPIGNLSIFNNIMIQGSNTTFGSCMYTLSTSNSSNINSNSSYSNIPDLWNSNSSNIFTKSNVCIGTSNNPSTCALKIKGLTEYSDENNNHIFIDTNVPNFTYLGFNGYYNGSYEVDFNNSVKSQFKLYNESRSGQDYLGLSYYNPFNSGINWACTANRQMSIGKSNPHYTCDIGGDLNFEGNLYHNGSLVTFTSNSNVYLSNIPDPLNVNTINSTVGNITTINSHDLYLLNGLLSYFITIGTSASNYYLENNQFLGKNILSLNSYTTNSNIIQTHSFYSDGTSQQISGSPSWSIPSDIRLKTNIKDLDNSLEKILLLRPIQFDWKIKEAHNNKIDYGFIAQEVETIFHHLITKLPLKNKKEKELIQGDECYGLNMDLIPFLVKSIQELKQEIDELKKQLNNIK